MHIDRYNFPYEIEITRGDGQDPATLERYKLYVSLTRDPGKEKQTLVIAETLRKQKLFESTAQPPLYLFAGKYYKRKWARPIHLPRSETPQQLGRQLALFKNFFRVKTGLDWEDRVIYYGTTSKDKFQYTPPVSEFFIIRDTPREKMLHV